MSVWTFVEGTITVSKESHVSITKAIADYFGRYEAKPNITYRKITPTLIEHAVNFSYSLENEGAYKAWKEFADYLKDALVVTDYRTGMDCTVSIRWII